MMELLRQKHGRVELLTLNRPESANALNTGLLDALMAAFYEIERDDNVRAVVLTGAGEKHFCAGMDLQGFAEERDNGSSIEGTPGAADGGGVLELFKNPCAKPLVAAVNGAAVGGGFELVLACDLVVAAEPARFGLPEVRRGLVAGGGGTLLGTRIPLALALEVGLSGQLMDSARALAYGLVNRIVPAADLLETALSLATAIADNAPLAVQTTKLLMRRAVAGDPEGAWGSTLELSRVFGSDDALEGAMAFVEKRDPVWKGR